MDDIFGHPIEKGTIVAFVSSAAKIDVAVVTDIKIARNGRLIGYKVEYPQTRQLYPGKKIITKKKMIRASRELIAIPPAWASHLQSAQASWTHAFANRLAYLAEKVRPAKPPYEPKFGPEVFFSQDKDE